LDRLKARYDRDLRCRECGYVDEDGGWQARTSGGRISYRHVCPSCGTVEKRTLRLTR
jgi:rubredoxin